jgi:hypothetical protein
MKTTFTRESVPDAQARARDAEADAIEHDVGHDAGEQGGRCGAASDPWVHVTPPG